MDLLALRVKGALRDLRALGDLQAPQLILAQEERLVLVVSRGFKALLDPRVRRVLQDQEVLMGLQVQQDLLGLQAQHLDLKGQLDLQGQRDRKGPQGQRDQRGLLALKEATLALQVLMV